MTRSVHSDTLSVDGSQAALFLSFPFFLVFRWRPINFGRRALKVLIALIVTDCNFVKIFKIRTTMSSSHIFKDLFCQVNIACPPVKGGISFSVMYISNFSEALQ